MSDDTRISADEARALREKWRSFDDTYSASYLDLVATQWCVLNSDGEAVLRVEGFDDSADSADCARLFADAPRDLLATADTVIALHAEVARLTEALRRSREAHALDLHAVMEYLTPGAAPADVSGDAVIEAARQTREIIEGRTTPPTDEEIEAHAKAGGSWLALRCGAAMWWSIEVTRFRDMAASLGLTATWIALDADARPCPWPVVGGAR